MTAQDEAGTTMTGPQAERVREAFARGREAAIAEARDYFDQVGRNFDDLGPRELRFVDETLEALSAPEGEARCMRCGGKGLHVCPDGSEGSISARSKLRAVTEREEA